MKVVLNDLQDYSSPLDGAVVHNQKELFVVLESARDREPFACELVGENGYMLTLGIGKEVGSVQYSPSNYDTPYLLALASGYHAGEGEREEEYVEFLCGNTPTPFYKRHTLPFDTVKQIAAYFIETGERSPEVSWEEV